jgi:hypothetical protein
MVFLRFTDQYTRSGEGSDRFPDEKWTGIIIAGLEPLWHAAPAGAPK